MFDTIHNTSFLGLFTSFGWQEIIILLVIGVLIFGKRLPEVGRNFGKSIVEFKKGIKGVGDEIDAEADRQPTKIDQPAADLPPAKVTPDPGTSKEAEKVEQPHDEA
ncbi:MAG: twin-arginine translocase TatA/TatE family subunit [Phycisphaerales bacterium]|jgi:sec-independent protein translocase protein TatA|nr:twin-arginine translocase TatA/TatE family subunit [Phycisphaerales bacterium]